MTTLHTSTTILYGEADEAINIALERIVPKQIAALFGFLSVFTLICHGSKHGPCPIVNGRARCVPVPTLARFIADHPDYHGQPVLLLMCWAGDDFAATAQRIARLLKRPVIACTTMVCAATGEPRVYDAEGNIVPGGTWMVFWP